MCFRESREWWIIQLTITADHGAGGIQWESLLQNGIGTVEDRPLCYHNVKNFNKFAWVCRVLSACAKHGSLNVSCSCLKWSFEVLWLSMRSFRNILGTKTLFLRIVPSLGTTSRNKVFVPRMFLKDLIENHKTSKLCSRHEQETFRLPCSAQALKTPMSL